MLLGYFIAHGIGTKKDKMKGTSLILESGADKIYDNFAEIRIYYYELSQKAQPNKAGDKNNNKRQIQSTDKKETDKQIENHFQKIKEKEKNDKYKIKKINIEKFSENKSESYESYDDYEYENMNIETMEEEEEEEETTDENYGKEKIEIDSKIKK